MLHRRCIIVLGYFCIPPETLMVVMKLLRTFSTMSLLHIFEHSLPTTFMSDLPRETRETTAQDLGLIRVKE